MRFCIDTEFLEDGKTIDLISIGIVAEDGREYYRINRNAPWRRILQHGWLMSNVVPHLKPAVTLSDGPTIAVQLDHPDVAPRKTIAQEVREFLLEPDGDPELWAWFSAYDHVVFAQLYGPMAQLPAGLPYFTRDIKSEHVRLGYPELPEQPRETEHHALHDARHDWARLHALEAPEAPR